MLILGRCFLDDDSSGTHASGISIDTEYQVETDAAILLSPETSSVSDTGASSDHFVDESDETYSQPDTDLDLYLTLGQ